VSQKLTQKKDSQKKKRDLRKDLTWRKEYRRRQREIWIKWEDKTKETCNKKWL